MSRPRLVRLDRWMVDRGWADDKASARALIQSGRVQVNGLPVTAVERRVRVDEAVLVRSDSESWVGRGATKLLGALSDLPMVVDGAVCADLGSSTGGFTQVLLRRGATHVYAVDVGKNLLHRSLQTDPRVTEMAETNVRGLTGFPREVTRMVGDLSFISLQVILPVVFDLLPPGGQAVLLIKPQFEADRKQVQTGGTLSDEVRTEVIEDMLSHLDEHGWTILGHADSRLAGAKSGNLEHFVWVERPG